MSTICTIFSFEFFLSDARMQKLARQFKCKIFLGFYQIPPNLLDSWPTHTKLNGKLFSNTSLSAFNVGFIEIILFEINLHQFM